MHLVERSLQKRAVNRDNRMNALCRESCGESHRMRLRDSHIEKSVGKSMGEIDQARSIRHGRGDGNHAGILAAIPHIASPKALLKLCCFASGSSPETFSRAVSGPFGVCLSGPTP